MTLKIYFLTWRANLILDGFYFSVSKREPNNEFLFYIVDLFMIPLLKEGVSLTGATGNIDLWLELLG